MCELGGYEGKGKKSSRTTIHSKGKSWDVEGMLGQNPGY